MKSTKAVTWTLCGSLLVQSGCGALVFHNPETVLVTCNVAGASAEASGESRQCITPGTLQLDRTQDHIVVVRAPGYGAQSVRIDSHPSWWRIAFSVILNGAHGIFTLFISTAIGLGIDVAAGAWQALDEDEVYVELHREGFEAPSLSGVRRGETSPLAPADVEKGDAPPAPVPPDARPTPPTWINRGACPNCGSHVRSGDRFCSTCGERLPAGP